MRKKSDSAALRNEYLLVRIKAIKKDHPFWGYRRVLQEYRWRFDKCRLTKKRRKTILYFQKIVRLYLNCIP